MYTWIFDLSGSSNVHVSHRDRADEDMHGATTWSRWYRVLDSHLHLGDLTKPIGSWNHSMHLFLVLALKLVFYLRPKFSISSTPVWYIESTQIITLKNHTQLHLRAIASICPFCHSWYSIDALLSKVCYESKLYDKTLATRSKVAWTGTVGKSVQGMILYETLWIVHLDGVWYAWLDWTWLNSRTDLDLVLSYIWWNAGQRRTRGKIGRRN